MYERFSVFLIALVILTSCSPQITTPEATPTPVPSKTPTSLAPFNIEDYQPPENAIKTSVHIPANSKLTVSDLAEAMPWYSFAPYSNSEVLKVALEQAGFKVGENEQVAGNGELYLIPSQEFVRFFEENLELGAKSQGFYPPKQVLPARFEKYQPTWTDGFPFEAYLLDNEIRLVVSNQSTLDTNIIPFDIDPNAEFQFYVDGNLIDPNLILKREKYIGVPVKAILGSEMEFGLSEDVFSRSLEIRNDRGEIKFNILLAPSHWNVSLGNAWEGSRWFNENVPAKASRIASVGATGMEFAITYFVEDQYSEIVYQGQWSADEATIMTISEYASINGLKTVLSLHLVADETRWEWAGLLKPGNMNNLKQSYANDYVIPIAILAEKYEIDSLSIINELDWAASDEKFVLDLIKRVREVYSGEIGIKLGAWKGNQPGGFLIGLDYGSIFTILSPSVIEEVDWLGLNLYIPGPNKESCSDKEALVAYMVPKLDYIATTFQDLDVEINKLRLSENGTSNLKGGCIVPWQTNWNTELSHEDQALYIDAVLNSLKESKLGYIGGYNLWAFMTVGCWEYQKELGCNPPSFTDNPYIDDVLKEYYPFQ